MTVSDEKTPAAHIFQASGNEMDGRLKRAFIALDKIEAWISLTSEPADFASIAREIRCVRRALADHA